MIDVDGKEFCYFVSKKYEKEEFPSFLFISMEFKGVLLPAAGQHYENEKLQKVQIV